MIRRFARCLFLWAPALVIGGWATAIWALGWSATMTGVALIVLTVAVVLHTYQSVHDYAGLNRRRS